MIYVYMIKNEHKNLYIGIANNPIKRLANHNARHGTQYTKTGTFYIVFLEQYSTLAQARKREIQIKKWRRDKKEKLIQLYREGKETRMLVIKRSC